MIEHHIQRQILQQLAIASSMRFSELKPDELENNSFMYHLKALLKSGYVRQSDDKTYALTPSGAAYVDSLTYTNRTPRRQPKLLCILALKNADDRYLLTYRKMKPSRHTWMLPSGKQHFGESAESHAAREVREQLGTSVPLTRRGLVDIRFSEAGELVSHIVAHVYEGDYEGVVPAATERFIYDWKVIDDTVLLTPGTREILNRLRSEPGLFFLSLDASRE